MALILHAGAEPINYDGLRQLTTPEATATHVPIACDFCGGAVHEDYAVVSLPGIDEKARVHWGCLEAEEPFDYIIWFDECSAND